MDTNAIPPEYVLQPRGKEYEEYSAWEKIEIKLKETLRESFAGGENDHYCSDLTIV